MAGGVTDREDLKAYFAEAASWDHDRFIAANRDPRAPIIFAGDFNASSPQRRNFLVGHSTADWTTRKAQPVLSALQQCLLPSAPCGVAPAIAGTVLKRGRDWQFYTPGLLATLQAVKLTIPFGRERDGGMLSDHVGYGIVYRLGRAALARPRLS